MSTRLLNVLWRQIVLLVAAGFCLGTPALGQQLKATINVEPETGSVTIELSGRPGSKWSFRDSYAGVLGLGNRLEQFAAFEENGTELPVRRIAPGQFDSAKPAARVRYRIKLTPPFSSDAARVSWLTADRGLLMAADLLPLTDQRMPGEALLRVEAPPSWAVRSNEAQENQASLAISDLDRVVFAASRTLRTSRLTESGMNLQLVTDGEQAFADGDVTEMAGKILKAYRELFGAMPAKQATLIILPFPANAAVSQWTAETRGQTVTVLIAKQPSKVGALAQLSTPLTHELFHLWMPNALALEGDYGWFYEGFTVYLAARTAVDLGWLTFPEFLNAIARAFDGVAAQSNSLSLIEASSQRWTTGQSAVYSKSMVIAFLYDLRMRRAHSSKSLNVAYKNILQQHAAGVAVVAEGNDVAISVLGVDTEAAGFVRQFIQTPVTINLAAELVPFGLQVETLGLRTRISVGEKLSKGQRDLLRNLGYNDVVRSPRR